MGQNSMNQKLLVFIRHPVAVRPFICLHFLAFQADNLIECIAIPKLNKKNSHATVLFGMPGGVERPGG
jgi:hypothetical protein